jgi:hypothetical protein
VDAGVSVLGRAHDFEDVTGHSLWTPLPAAVPTLVRLSSSHAGVPEGEPLALAAEVVAVSGQGEAPPSGTVAFVVAGQLLGHAVLDATGQAVLDGLHLPVGVHAVVASYAGDRFHAAASSAPLPQAVTATAAPVVVLVTGPVETPDGLLLEAEVVDPRTGRLADDATGPVVFTVGGQLIGQTDLVDGRGALLVASVPAGRLRVSFAGDTEHASAVGSAPA